MVLRISASSIHHRKQFNLANKNVDETLEQWYDRLKSLAVHCDYGSHSEAFIFHQFVCGLDVLILDYLHAEQKDLSLFDVLDLAKSFERSNEPVDVKPTVLLNIKQEEQQYSDGENFNDNTYSDSDDDDRTEATVDVNNASTNDAKQDEDNPPAKTPRKDDQVSVHFMAETVIDLPEVPRLFECYLCHKTWKTAGNLTYHFTCYHTIGKTSKCHLCGKWIHDSSNMVRHLNTHFEMKQFRCNICDFSFARSYSLRKHLLLHNNSEEEYKCSKCAKVFVTKQHLKLHKHSHEQPLATLSEQFDKMAKEQKLQMAKAKSGLNGKYKCDLCAVSCESEPSLVQHMKVHCETEWLCHLCGKKLMNKRNLIHHYRVHTNEKPFSCSGCDRTFASKEKLKLHSKTHSGTRAHCCTLCSKSFLQKGHLVKHMKVHFPDSKFKCDQCSREFLKEEKLNRHVLMHARGGPGCKTVACNYCDKLFRTNHHRTEHERTHTGEKPYHCTICPKSFGQRSTLRGHLKMHARPKVERPPKKKKKQKVDESVGYALVQATAAYLG